MPALAACTFSSSSFFAPSNAVVATVLEALKASAWAFIRSSIDGNMLRAPGWAPGGAWGQRWFAAAPNGPGLNPPGVDCAAHHSILRPEEQKFKQLLVQCNTSTSDRA